MQIAQVAFQIGQRAVPSEDIENEREEESRHMNQGNLGFSQGKDEPKYEEEDPDKMQ
jgi:hypothetical protein